MEFYNQLKEYFKNTSKEQLDKDWNEIKSLNKSDVDVIEWFCKNNADFIYWRNNKNNI